MTDPGTGQKHGRIFLRKEYVTQVAKHGGVPIILPPGSDGVEIAPLLDGLVISGGGDLDPSLYGAEPHAANDYEDPMRPEFEQQLLANLNSNVPIFGICYGCQLLNVVHGGSLIQHLPDVVGDSLHTGDPVQSYAVHGESKLGSIIGTSGTGKSSHHQAVGTVGEGLRVVANHEDGTVEAIETTDDRWRIGVQWHPERTDSETTQRLFASFLAAATKYKQEKDSCAVW
jgi:putative glutamine amidotransferase